MSWGKKAVYIAGGLVLIFILIYAVRILQTGNITDRSHPSRRHTILIDSIHAHNYLDTGAGPDNYDYHSLCGTKDAFDYLREQGYHLIEITDDTLDQELLQNADTFFLNLVSDNLPPFLIEEIYALKAFVEDGGNLLVITDHSNCYHHTYKLAPLFHELGIRPYNESALEMPPHTLGSGHGWILIDHFGKHPITRNLSVISFHAGGTVDSVGAVAFLSTSGWGDLWETAPYGENSLEDGNRGNYGNFKHDRGERTGSLGVILARQSGKGKVVVVGDQNIFGNLWLRFADNYKLWLNIFAWFADRPDLADYRSFVASENPRILMLDEFTISRFANSGTFGYYNAYAWLSRYMNTYINEKVEHSYDLLVLSPSVRNPDTTEVVTLRNHLSQGRNILILREKGNSNVKFLAPMEDGLTVNVRQEADDHMRIEYVSGGVVEVYYHAERFDNTAINKPTQEPDQKEAARAQELLELIRSLLPPAAIED